MEFALVGKFTKSNDDIERLIRKLGGKIDTEIHTALAAIISTTREVQKMGTQMQEARKNGIQVVTDDFLTEIQRPDVDPILYILSKSICDWGRDVSWSK